MSLFGLDPNDKVDPKKKEIVEGVIETLKEKHTAKQVASNDLNKVAVKYDQQKPKMSLVPPLGLLETAKVMTYGANKYAEYNWMKGFKWTRLVDAAMRHLTSFNIGEDIDPESGLPHLAHAACCVLMLYDITQLHPEMDDRWEGWKQLRLQLENVLATQEKTSGKE